MYFVMIVIESNGPLRTDTIGISWLSITEQIASERS